MKLTRAHVKDEETRHEEMFLATTGGWHSSADKRLADTLAGVALALELPSPSSDRMRQSLDCLGLVGWKSDAELIQAKQRCMEMHAAADHATQLCLTARSTMQHVPPQYAIEQALATADRETTANHQRVADNEQTLSELQEKLKQNGYYEGLDHSTLLKDLESLSKVDLEIQELDKKLEVFDGLPDDLAEAEAALATVEDELHRLQMDDGGCSPASVERPSADRESRWFGV